MQLKLHLNKFLKVDNIEGYNMSTLLELQKAYDKFIENSEGYDPDFPMSNLGGGNKKEGMKNIKLNGSNNLYKLFDDEEGGDPRGKARLDTITKAKLAKTKNNNE